MIGGRTEGSLAHCGPGSERSMRYRVERISLAPGFVLDRGPKDSLAAAASEQKG